MHAAALLAHHVRRRAEGRRAALAREVLCAEVSARRFDLAGAARRVHVDGGKQAPLRRRHFFIFLFFKKTYHLFYVVEAIK